MRRTYGLATTHVFAFAALVLGGCLAEPEGQTDIAKLPLPSQEVLDAAKARARPNPRPKFGSPPKSEMGKP